MNLHNVQSDRRFLAIVAAFMLLAANPAETFAQLSIREGLCLWLDSSALAKEKGAGDATEPIPVSVWKDATDATNALAQTDLQSQPLLVRVGKDFVVRFDGKNDFLRSVGNMRQAEQLSVFVVAAPHENVGDFSGFFAANAVDQRDYQSGFNLDLGPGPTRRFETLNVEGIGFGGAADLLDSTFEFGTLHTMAMIVDPNNQIVSVRVDGKPTGQRTVSPSTVSLAELTLGARYFTNGHGDQRVRCLLKCDIAEVLVFDRTLSEDEIVEVEAYLTSKHKPLAEQLPRELNLASANEELVKVANPPAIQMLVPGFEIAEIPVELTNVNNVRFRQDGTLITLGYNGDVHLLQDTDGDGLEDEAKVFWKNNGSLRGPIGMLVTPQGYVHGRGIFTPSKGKLSLIVDKDGDDVADKEIVVASGWNEITQNVDATGIAMDSEGYLYFGLGTANYSNAYLVDESGVAKYDITSDRGTVQRVSPDFGTRETVCTGIRFPIAFAFNKHGDLFCSEQEGATWLANGNPFDELLHIEPNKHYGFPPRHPRHNPDVLDEPSVFDYAPQHQSTCGMVFNEPVNNARVFGPNWWADQAIVCGESRGKIWRTQLSKSVHGYVATTQLLACLQMLTVDACIAPNGDLVVACHSGPPDWGTGPTGIGKLYRIRMRDADVARPASVWANSEREIQIAFDRSIDPFMFQGIADKIEIHYGDFVRAGDHFETLVPPYAVVQRQLTAPRHKLNVRGMAFSKDRRNLLLQTDPMQANTHYAVSLPYNDNLQMDADEDASTKQHRLIDIDFSLNGVEAIFESNAVNADLSSVIWKGWLPHIDWQVSHEFNQQSAAHDQLRDMISSGGTLTLMSKLDLENILRPAVQPGSSLDYDWPEEIVSLHFQSSQPLRITVGNNTLVAAAQPGGGYGAMIAVEPSNLNSVPLEMQINVAASAKLDWTIAVSTNEDARLRVLPLRRFFLPWTTDQDATQSVSEPTTIAEIEGGSWGRGRRVFHSEAASCFKCHAIHGPGEIIGPDLTNLVHRDYASVLRDIRNPSFAINPDHLGQVLLMKDDRILTGVLRTENNQLYLGEANGKVTRIPRDEIASIKPAEVSIMPQGVDEKLTAEQMLDLMTFLLTPPPQMPLDSPLQAPPVRTRAEVAKVLAGAEQIEGELRLLNIVLIAGDKDHGPGEHDYPAWQMQWGQLLTAAANTTVDAAWGFPSDQQLAQADMLVFFQKGMWDDQRQKKMDAYFERGGGAAYIHWAVNGDDRAADFSKRIGLASKGGSIGYRHGPLSLQVHNTDHPIMRNIDPFQLYDESYWRLTGDVQDVTLFATSVEDRSATPQMWAYERGRGRVFVSIPGHYNWTFDDPIFRTLLLRGMAWTAREPVDRFNDLLTLGARMAN